MKKKKKVNKKEIKKNIITISIIISVFIIIFFVCFKLGVKIVVNGDDEYNLQVGQKYSELGANLVVFGNYLDKKITTKNNIDNKKLGKYYVQYETRYLLFKVRKKRKVYVVDTISPIVRLNGKSTIYLEIDEKYEEEGAIAYDNYDKDITKKIKIDGNVDSSKEGTYEITYTAIDSSKNERKVTRKVIVGEEKESEELDEIEQYITDNDLYVSIGYYNLKNGKTYYYNEDELYYSASLIKTLDALYLYDNDMVDDDIKEYIKDAISISDNDAHFYLFDYIGYDNLREYGESLGAEDVLSFYDEFGETTVKDQIAYYKRLYELFKTNEELKSFFINDYYNALDFDDKHFAHKYGYFDLIYHDAGIYLGDDPYIVVILTYEGDEEYNEVDEVTELSKLIYNYHLKTME